MKTALLKTDLWDDDLIYGLNLDTKLLYLIILTSPERGVARIYKLGQRIQSFRSGLNPDALKHCQSQLEELGLVKFYEGYVYLTEKSSFVQPTKGKLTAPLLDKELSSLPKNVISYFQQFAHEPLMSRSGATQEYVNDNDNVNVNGNDIEKVKVKDQVANEIATELHSLVENNFSHVKSTPKKIERSYDSIEKLHRIDNYPYDVIRGVMVWSQNDEFWKQNIWSGDKLRKQFARLLAQAKVQHDKLTERVTFA